MQNKINKLPKEIETKTGLIVLIALVVIASTAILVLDKVFSIDTISFFYIKTPAPKPQEFKNFKTFAGVDEFKEYLAQSQDLESGLGGWGAVRQIGFVDSAVPMLALEEGGAKGAQSAPAPDRISQTTVQTIGIDEPDIVKTDGTEIYFSSFYIPGPWYEGGIYPRKAEGLTKAIKAFPPSGLEVVSEIEKGGNLLLSGNILAVFTSNGIIGYNIANPKSPTKEWQVDYSDNNYLVDARLKEDKIYLITKESIHYYEPCPIRPLTLDGRPVEIACTSIYYPEISAPIDITYTASVIHIETGELEKTLSFVGKESNSVVYVSDNALYVTYGYYQDAVKFVFNFFEEKAKDLIPQAVRAKIEKLAGYDISQAAKMTELQIILEQFENSLDDDERMRVENELTNRMGDYYESHKRDLQKTGIVKISLAGLEIAALGEVPGAPLNQFSLDEYNNHLRIATTISQSWGIWAGLGESESDVYVLNNALKETGSVKGLAEGERIYSVRFLGGRGYIVTFKQIDPFFVLDLSEPEKPEVKGELKIPGFSSYLHPIAENKILGIGKDGSYVKVSLFDVSEPSKPNEASKYTLQEYWSDILNTHHAFLEDSKHSVFFLPGGQGGYIFSYKNDKLTLERAVSGISAKRAVYINDYFYIIGEDKIIVLNELNWEKVNELEL